MNTKHHVSDTNSGGFRRSPRRPTTVPPLPTFASTVDVDEEIFRVFNRARIPFFGEKSKESNDIERI